jgi:hypothetical protein
MSALSGTLTTSMTRCGHEATERGRSGAGDETTGRYVAGNGQADHVVSGSGDPRHQLPADAAMVVVHEHLDDTLSITFGPHVVGRFQTSEAVEMTPPPKASLPAAAWKSQAKKQPERNGGGDRTRTCIAFRPAVFKTAALPLCDPSAEAGSKEYSACCIVCGFQTLHYHYASARVG